MSGCGVRRYDDTKQGTEHLRCQLPIGHGGPHETCIYGKPEQYQSTAGPTLRCCIVCGGITFTRTETGAWACNDCEQTYWDDMKIGDRCYVARHATGQVARVMAVAEGYAMLRYPQCAPFVEAIRDLIKTT